jgi:hypothetical protein
MSIFDRVAGEKIGSALGNRTLGGILGGAVGTIGTGMIKKGLPPGVGPRVDALGNAAGRLLSGDLKGAALTAINSGIFTANMPWLDGAAATTWFMSQPARAMGGVTPVDAKRIMQDSLATHFARKNLFMVSIDDQPIQTSDVQCRKPGGLEFFNMFVLDVSYGPITISAEAHKIGSAVLDQPNGTEAVELRLTTMDDERGTIKSWFSQLSGRVANDDGTMGVPFDYLSKITITHSFVTDDAAKHWLKDGQPWRAGTYFRPVSLELDLSRKEDALEEFTMVFHRFDTYYK